VHLAGARDNAMRSRSRPPKGGRDHGTNEAEWPAWENFTRNSTIAANFLGNEKKELGVPTWDAFFIAKSARVKTIDHHSNCLEASPSPFQLQGALLYSQPLGY
jgi:hypothetical protein